MSPEIMAVSSARSKDVIERCNDSFQAHLEAIGDMIRVEIRALEKARDDTLRSKMHDQKNPMAFAFEMDRLCQESSEALLRLLRPELHKAIENLMDQLVAETLISETVGPRRLLTPPTPTSSRMLPGPPASENPLQPRAPVANMDSDILSPLNRARSVTMPAFDHPPVPGSTISVSSVIYPSPTQTERTAARKTPPAPTPSTPTNPQSKRAGADAISTTPSKRAKTSTTEKPPPKVTTPSKKTAASSTTPQTPASRGRKSDGAKKASRVVNNQDDDDEYQQSQSLSDAELNSEFPPISEIRSKEFAHRAAKGKKPVYLDKPLQDDEFLDI
ncbi:hypothetical protein PFICI_13708 [Pestalotiopsis fici W106-1]|uniref:Uncharacterized protein n=1 Tax=Pestalotiopsis fici (strain W106-1 / CGMCC3.15140) TaxID=1229662 RepID=W3WN83_PESFW|nr:uncharacterized protein PFICI_13708 [Pestalotiopsis fici W106-1]ETS75224.1 hypothetical protein PFICI_13708 [Pestalotiopsis fici W106-1]